MGVTNSRLVDLREALDGRYLRFGISERKMAAFISELSGNPMPGQRLGIFITRQLRLLGQDDLLKVNAFIWDNDNRSNTQKAVDAHRLHMDNRRHYD